MPVSQAVEGGGPASELLAAFRAQRMGALGGRGLAANGVDAGYALDPGQQSLAEGTGFSSTSIRNGTGTVGDDAPDTAGRDGNGPGRVPPAPVTAGQLRAIMPNAGGVADRYVDVLNQAMAAHGINTPAQRAAFLAQVSVESEGLRSVVEGMNYSSAQRIRENFRRTFHTEAEAQSYVHNPEALANHAYAGVNGNRDEASGDGFRFRGRGLIQITGRGLYREVGAENNPESLAEPQNAANSAAIFWQNRRLNDRTTGMLNRAQFNAVTHTINTAELEAQERWEAYQCALIVFSGK